MRYIFIIFLSLLSLNSASGQQSADRIINKVYDGLEKMNPYEVKIEVVYGNSSILGFYQVDKDNYYISIDQQELYGNSREKYEIFNSRKEIVIDKVAPEYNGNILSNPATAFASILTHYTADIISEGKDITRLELKQNGGDEIIELSVWNSSLLPESIIYRYGDDEIIINIYSISKLTSTIKSYNNSDYVDYEIIDFR